MKLDHTPQTPWRALRASMIMVTSLSLIAASAVAQAPAVSMGKAIDVRQAFLTGDMKKSQQRGISGFACLPALNPGQPVRRCVGVNDEERFVEWADLEASALTPTGRTVQLLEKGQHHKDKVVGTMPKGLCRASDGFKEFDGEAIAIANHGVYVIGSHACSRKDGKFRPSSFVLARFDAADGGLPTSIQRTWRVSEVIRRYSGLGLGKHGVRGANIEGMAIVGPDIFFGFRTPPGPAGPIIVRTLLEPLFEAGSAMPIPVTQAIDLKLGPGIGIRDLAALADGRLLVLTGPANEEAAPYLLHVLEPDTGTVTTLVELRSDQPGVGKNRRKEVAKAEAVAVLRTTPESITLIVFHDNIDDGGPRIHTVPLPRAQAKVRVRSS